MNPTPTAPAPQTKRVQVPLKQLVEAWRWSATVNQYPDQSIDRPPDAQLIASALLVAVDRLTQIARADRSALILDELRKIRALLTPAPPATTDPDAERQRRELASRLRAGEAYRRAGGTMPLDDRPPVTPDTP